jgi:hypothetical protein
MKTQRLQSLHIAHLTVAVLAMAVAASVSAQTVITPDLKATLGSYNTSSTGMVLRAHQIAIIRSPGDQNSIANVLKELSGGFGPSLSGATNGPLTGGFWREDYLNYALDSAVLSDSQWWFFAAPILPFPGINTDTSMTGGASTFAFDIVTFLNLPAGTNYLVVGSGDSFRLTIGVGDNPYTLTAVQPGNGQADGTRNYDTNLITLNVQSAGVYPVRIIYGQGSGTAGLQFYSLYNQGSPQAPDYVRVLVNDPNPPASGAQLTAYQPVLPISPSKAYISQLIPVPNEAGVSPLPTVQVQLTDGSATTVTNVSTLAFDGVPVSPSITKTGAVTYVTYTVPSLLTNLSVHTNLVVAQDSAGNVLSNQWSFTVGSSTVVPASWAYPAGSGDATKPGFAGRIHQLRANAFISTSIATANSQLAGELIDPNTGQPYINMVVTNGNPIIGAGWSGTQAADAGGGPGESRTFTQTNVVNYSIADGSGNLADIGEFNSSNGKPDSLWPGLPGSTDATFGTYDNAVEFAAEVIGWIELPAGAQELGVNCDDGFQLAISPNDSRDIFRTDLMNNERDRDATTSRVTVFVQTNGLYSFRLIYRAFRNNLPNALEWFRYDPANPSQPVLINDKVAGAVKSYRAVTVPTRPYVKSVTPVAGASGVGPTTPVSVVLVNLGTNQPVLKVNSSTVATTAATNGNEVTLTYTPPTPLSGNVNCEVSYGGVVGQWSYAVRTGRKAMLVVNGSTASATEQAIANRLAVVHGLDVEVKDVGLFNADASTLSFATNKALILVSSSIGSGAMQNWARAFVSSNTAVPVMTWEYGNVDDWALNNDGGNGNAANGQTQVQIANAPNELTAGLTNGVYTVATNVSCGQSWMTSVPAGAIVAALSTAGTNPRIVGIPSGLTVDPNPLGVPITHASRKVYFGLTHNTGAEVWNDNGWALFDAAVVWLAPAPPAPPVLSVAKGPGAGQMTLSWTSSGTLQTATNVAAPAWISAPSQSNPQTAPTTGTQRYYRIKQ